MEYLFIYLLQLASVIPTACILFACIMAAMFMIFLGILASLSDSDIIEIFGDNKTNRARQAYIIIMELKKVAITCLTLIVILGLLPTKQTMLLMGGTYLGKRAVNTIATDEKMQKIDTIINLQLDNYIKELKK